VTLALSKIIIVPILQQNIDYFRDFYRLLFIVFSHYDKFQSWRSSQAPNSTTLKLPAADELWCGGGDSVTAM
jgi:hypothetical protein